MKRRITFLVIFILSVTGLKAQLYQDWKWAHQLPQGNDLKWVKMWDANTVYAAGARGTFIKTTDGGASWVVNNTAGRMSGIPLQRANIACVWFFDQNTGITAGTYGSIFRTTNGGITFDSVPGNPATTSVNFTGISFINNLTGYVISQLTNYRMLKTTDGGLNWFAAPGSPPFSNPYFVHAFNENKIIVFNQLGDNYITTNGGAIWNLYPIGSQVTFYKAVFTDANTGYACGDWGRCRYTTDGGYNWTNMSGSLFDRPLYFFDVDVKGGAVYLTGNSNYIYKSTNLGVTWDSVSFIAPAAQQPWSNYFYNTDFLSTADTMVTVGAKGGVHQMLGAGMRTMSQYLKTGSLRDICITSAGTIIAVGSPSSSTASLQTHDQILRSTNNGMNWAVVQPSPASASDFYSIEMVNSATGFVCGSKSAVYKTTNGGVNWDSLVIPNMPAGLVLTKVDFVNEQTGWVFSRYLTGYDSTIYKTTNGGANWFKQKFGTATGTENTINAACMLDANTGWLLSNKPRPWKTTNGGASWDSTGLGDNYLAGSLYSIKMLNATTGYCSGANNRVYRTTNGGATPWTNVSYSSTTVITNYKVEFVNALEGIVAGTYGTVYYTSNGGQSWINKNLVSTIDDIYGACVSPSGYLFAVTLLNAGIFRNGAMFPVGVNEAGVEVPEGIRLEQNYPNPFNGQTVVSVQLSAVSYVSLKIYDVMGREVAVLVNGRMQAGRHEVRFEAGRLASGVYFYGLVVNGKMSGVRRMVLLR